jgi:outer membrane protein assembly factor BamB
MFRYCLLSLSAILWISGYVHGQDVNSLWAASVRGDLPHVRQCISAGVDLNAKTEYGVTALSVACDHGHEAVVQALLEAGADPNTQDRFYRISPLGWAISRKHVGVVKLLIEAGVKDVDSALGSAMGSKQWEVVKIILASDRVSEKALGASFKAIRKLKSADPNSEAVLSIEKLIGAKLTDAVRQSLEKEEEPKPTVSKWSEYLGTYKGKTGSFVVRASEETLSLFDPDQERTITLEVGENNSFTTRGATISFDRQEEKIVAMRWKTEDRETIYTKLKENDPIQENNPIAKIELREDFPFDNENWPNFRGFLSRGINNGKEIPTQWNGESRINIANKIPIPGLATSSPIVWENKVFITTAVQESEKSGFRTGLYGDVESVDATGECSYQLLCIDADKGSILWNRESIREVPKVKRHAKSSHANPTPATDGQRVVAFFGGAGVFCYNMDGSLLWSKNLGMLDSGWFYDRSYQWGFGSSPFIFEDTVYLQCDVQEGAFLIAIHIETGETRWKVARDEIPTWSSPVAFVAQDGTPTIIATGTKCTAAYHARTGEKLWSMGGFSEIVVPVPQVLPELSLLTSGYAPVQPIVALLHSARGDLKIPTGSQTELPFVWAQMRGGPYMPTPVVAKGRAYVLENNGILSSYELNSGKRVFRQRLRGDKATAYTSSPVASHDKLYCTSEEGHTFVIAMNDAGTIVAQNDIDEAVLTSAAMSNGRLILRGEKHLFVIEEKR